MLLIPKILLRLTDILLKLIVKQVISKNTKNNSYVRFFPQKIFFIEVYVVSQRLRDFNHLGIKFIQVYTVRVVRFCRG